MQKEKMSSGNETRVLDIMSSEPRFTKLNEAIKAAGLIDRFSTAKSFTVFAPTNDAFAKLPQKEFGDLLKPENRDELRNLLLLHVVPGIHSPEDLKKAQLLTTEGGREIEINVSNDLNEIKIADARATGSKEEAKNGVVYSLDTVLLPMKVSAAAGKA